MRRYGFGGFGGMYRPYGRQAADSSDDEEEAARADETALARTAADEENTELAAMLDGPEPEITIETADMGVQTVATEAEIEAGGKSMTVSLVKDPDARLASLTDDATAGSTFDVLNRGGKEDEHETGDADMPAASAAASGAAGSATEGAEGKEEAAGAAGASASERGDIGDKFIERSKWIPLRLDFEERKRLRLCEAALNVSEYTDKVDIVSWKSKTHRVHKQLKDICAILCGLVVASDYKKGQRLIKNKQFKDNAALFQNIFEIGRRYKIMNPDRMRTDYGKLLYLLQDAGSPQMAELLEFNPIIPVRTVYRLLEAHEALDVLRDPAIEDATREIIAVPGKPRYQIQREIDRKNAAIKMIVNKYSRSHDISRDDLEKCLYSISDNNSYLTANRDPVDKMIAALKRYFKPESYEDGLSMAIAAGRGGARLTHSHTRQYHYVLQSLTLWREVNHDMFHLWLLAETDLLDGGRPYRLTDTGQGLNRLQAAPRIAGAMGSIIRRVQSQVGTWIGSSVVHLGDHNVPNALMFIDKYTQVGRILRPIMRTIEALDGLMEDEGIKAYIDSSFGGLEHLRKMILCDFFRHGFDGSGADNFFDAGSCIDGRLTSAWNWCSLLEKKRYFPVFQLTNFSGFDGDFK